MVTDGWRGAVRWLVVGLALTLVSCSPPTPQGPDAPLRFTSCAAGFWDASLLPDDRQDRFEIDCAVLAVPLDHADPARGHLDVAVVRARAKDQRQRIGSLVMNPGGPGVSGVDALASWAAWVPDELLTRFDLVSFDPRGTGRSAPIRCRALPAGLMDAPLPDLFTDTGWAAATELLQAKARACQEPLGDNARFFSTDATARDLDRLRAALGDARLSFVGSSYGARLGAHYARLFPEQARALVLDGPPAATAAWDRIVESQVAGFEAAYASYAAQCQTRETCASIGDGPRLLDRVVQAAQVRPIPSGRPAGDPSATSDVVLRSVLGFLAAPELWSSLDSALVEAAGGDSGSLYDMIDSLRGRTVGNPDADTDDAASVILCNDQPPGLDVGGARVAAAGLARRYPVFGEYGAWWLFACSYWNGPRPGIATTALTVAAPILILGTQADPSTPYAGVTDFAASLGAQGVLLTWAGSGHTAFGRSPCVGDHVTAYLIDLTTPEQGTVCS
jgi:pimeloyl-ACP methyl ester carboxylesterase